ncbi:M15 family metallopeptidase [Actinophytocola oryzae]|uniref:Prefoldin subunit 5 n=1 Tax=Actinophytocola oryzae TaxID=502181 RepID=A0A4V3FR19_9PSEU|nr:M15 family metallopeptidase [Actinophytocola oryzae]TDV41781.1 prefoldin subunit 5 [Actinophytocola oryzae]
MNDTIVASTGGTGTTGTTTAQAQNLLSHIKTTADAMEKGDVLGSAMGVANVAMDVIGIAGDPMGAITSAGVGWVLNAVSFLREPFDILKGDPSAITGSAQSWLSAAGGLTTTAQQYREASTSQTANWTGTAGNGYRTASGNQASGLEALAKASQAVSSAITNAGKAVAQARKTVMDLISEAVSKIIQICIEALSKSWLSFGASVAMGIAQSVQKAVSTAQKTVSEIQKVVQTLQQIIKTVQQIVQTVQQVKQLLQQIGVLASGDQQVSPQAQAVGYAPDTSGYYSTTAAGASGTHTPAAIESGAGLGALPAIPRVQTATDATQVAQLAQQQVPVSQNGWPVNPPRGARTIPGTDVRVNVADGPAGDVLMHVLGQVNSRVEGVALNGPAGEHDDWGYAERNVRGSQAISNHASATAVDINATRHVLGAQGTFTTDQTAEIHRILGEVDNVVRWGGDYTGRRDEMHFEIIGSQEQVAAVAARLRAEREAP